MPRLPSTSTLPATQPRRHPESGIALLLTLAMIVVLALMIVALVTTMRTERDTARAYNEATQVRWVAELALQEALARLADATPPTTSALVWVAAPGMIYQIQNGVISNYPLYNADVGALQGQRPAYDAADAANNLNHRGLICGFTTNYPLPGYSYGTLSVAETNAVLYGNRVGPYIAAGWVNIGADGNLPGIYTNASSVVWTNPIVARYTYWIDAETCKVNVNLAGQRNPTNFNQSLPGDLALRALGGVFASDASVTNYLSAARDFTTAEEMRLARGTWPALFWDSFNSNKFAVTTYGADLDVDAFGRPRVNLNTLTMADTNNSVFGDALWATMLYSNQVTETARNTLLKKYGPFGVAQIVANTLAYRGVSATDATVAGGDNAGIPGRFAGLRQGPLLSEFHVNITTNHPTPTNITTLTHCHLKVVNGWNSPVTGAYVAEVFPEHITIRYSDGSSQTNAPGGPASATFSGGVSPHGFADWSVVFTNDYVAAATNVAVQQVHATFRRVRLLAPDGAAVDWITRQDFTNVAPTGLTFTNFTATAAQGLGKQDPRVRTFPAWEGVPGSLAGSAATLTTNWARYAGNQINASGGDECSTNFTSRIAPDYFHLLADLRGAPVSHANLCESIAGTNFQSVGELGHIHTGYPWRTLRLRSVRPETSATLAWGDTATTNGIGDPNTGFEDREEHALPDWILLDMFTTTNAASIAGRVNLNQQFSGVATSVAARTGPLAALLLNTSSNLAVGASLDQIAGNIAHRAIVASNANPYANLPAYLTPGQICEVSGLGYFNDVSWHPSSADREQAIRRLANLLTTRADVFTIWIVAESVRDLGKDGTFDWLYEIKYRFWRSAAECPPNADPTDFNDKIVNNTNRIWQAVVDGDGNGKKEMDELLGRVRVQAVVQRYFDAADTAHVRPKYRLLYTRYWSD